MGLSVGGGVLVAGSKLSLEVGTVDSLVIVLVEFVTKLACVAKLLVTPLARGRNSAKSSTNIVGV